MEPVSFNGKTYTNPRRLLLDVLDWLPSKCLGLMYLANAVRLIKLRRASITIKMPVWFCHACGIVADEKPENNVCKGCGNTNGLSREAISDMLAKPVDNSVVGYVDYDGSIYYTPIKKLDLVKENIPNSGDKPSE